MTTTDVLDGTGLSHRRLAVVVLVAVSLLAWLAEPLTDLGRWVGWLPTTVGTSEAAVAWVPSLLCLFAAWVGGQPRTHGVDEWAEASPRSPARRIAPALLLVGGSAVAIQVTATGVLAAVSVRYGLAPSAGSLDLLLSIPTMTGYLLFWTAVGAALGRSALLPIALPLAAVLPYAAFAVVSLYLDDGPVAALAVGDGRVFDYVRPAASTTVIRAAFWMILAVVAWTRLLGRPRMSVASGWLASLVAALAFLQGASFVPLAGAESPTCRGAAPITCLDRSHESTLPRYRHAVERVLPAVPTALRPDAVGSTPDVLPAGVKFGLVVPPVAGQLEFSRVVDGDMFAARFGDALFRGSCSEGSAGAGTATALALWWRARLSVPLGGPAFPGDGLYFGADPSAERQRSAAAAFARLPEADRQNWFQDNRDRVLTCSAPALPVG